MAGSEEEIQVPILIVGADDVPIVLANQFIIQHQQQEFIITFGQVAPPYLFGTDEERREQAKNLSYVPIKIVGRFGLTRDRMVELIGVLQENLATFDKGRES